MILRLKSFWYKVRMIILMTEIKTGSITTTESLLISCGMKMIESVSSTEAAAHLQSGLTTAAPAQRLDR